MTDIPLGINDYSRKSAGNPSVRTRNVYFEQDPTNLDTQASLIRRPGLAKLLTVGAGPVRAIYHRADVFDNDFFVVSGTTLYRVSRTGDAYFDASPITGALNSDTTVSLSCTKDLLFVSDETSLYYTDGVSPLAAVTTPDGIPAGKVAYISGYIILVQNASQRFYWIYPGDTTIDPLNFAEAEGLPDGITDVVILGDQIYFFGKETTEVWYLTGSNDAPFARVQGKLYSTGALDGTACLVAGNDTFFFIAADGTARVGAQLQRVSAAGIEERIRRAIKDQNLASN